MNHLFVYGTLRPGHANEHILTPIGGTWQKASIMGKFHPEGTWLKGFMYPGINIDRPIQKIEGYVFTSPNLEHYWDKIDQFEGDYYKRVKAKIITENLETIIAYTYIIHPNIDI